MLEECTKKEGGDSKRDASLCFLNSEINFPNSVEEHNAILFKTNMRNQFVNSDILCEEFDVSFEAMHVFSLPGSLEEHFDRMLKLL